MLRVADLTLMGELAKISGAHDYGHKSVTLVQL